MTVCRTFSAAVAEHVFAGTYSFFLTVVVVAAAAAVVLDLEVVVVVAAPFGAARSGRGMPPSRSDENVPTLLSLLGVAARRRVAPWRWLGVAGSHAWLLSQEHP